MSTGEPAGASGLPDDPDASPYPESLELESLELGSDEEGAASRGDGKRHNVSWDRLTPGQKRAVVAAGAVQMALLAAAQVDLLRRPAEDVRGPKPAWFAANFVNFAGPVSYFVFGRRRRS